MDVCWDVVHAFPEGHRRLIALDHPQDQTGHSKRREMRFERIDDAPPEPQAAHFDVDHKERQQPVIGPVAILDQFDEREEPLVSIDTDDLFLVGLDAVGD